MHFGGQTSRWFVNWSLLHFASELVLAAGPRYPDVSMINDFYSDQDLISATTMVSCQLQGCQALTHILHLPSTIIYRTFMLCRRVLEKRVRNALYACSCSCFPVRHTNNAHLISVLECSFGNYLYYCLLVTFESSSAQCARVTDQRLSLSFHNCMPHCLVRKRMYVLLNLNAFL